jgi:hypothetical protein
MEIKVKSVQAVHMIPVTQHLCEGVGTVEQFTGYCRESGQGNRQFAIESMGSAELDDSEADRPGYINCQRYGDWQADKQQRLIPA